MNRGNILKSFLTILLYYMAFTLLQDVFIILKLNKIIGKSWLMIIVALLSLGCLLFVMKGKLKGQGKDFKNNTKKHLKTCFKCWIMWTVIMVLVNLFIDAFVLNELPPNEEMNRSLLEEMPLFSIVYTCILAPITEELLYRLNFRPLFKRKWSFILGTGIFFGAMHVVVGELNWMMAVHLVPYSILGIMFAQAYYETDNIYSSMLVHMANNTLAVVAILFGI